MDDLLADFLTETNESLAELDVALVTLERVPGDADTLAQIFRLVHTIKGTCGFLGLPRLETVAHAAENVLGQLRDRTLAVTPGLISLVLAALDRIKLILTSLGETGAEPAGDDSTLVTSLNAAATLQLAPNDTTGPAASDSPASTQTEDTRPVPPPAGAQTIRVAVQVLEDLMTLVSELVLTRNQLMQLARTQENAALNAPLQRLSHITSELQEGVMKTRMQPIGNAWNTLPRLVRDLAHETGKKIELTMLGAETELDRQVLELIKDPLTHMVRNSADHGLETPEQRRQAGKPETGRITLNAYQEGGHIIVEVSDDGRGLAVDRIRAKAVANGLATEAELATIPDTQVQRFIFRPGFSTAAHVTAVSGRGVGMDVVRTNVEKIGGSIDLKSAPGAGTLFTIKIPLTLAIASVLIVESGGERFAIPQMSVLELLRARSHAEPDNESAEPVIERINQTPVLRIRDRLLPLMRLSELLALEAPPETASSVTIVVVQVGSSMLGIIVDRVFDTEEIVVKPVAPILRDVTMFSGNTILGDGSVIMILDPNGLARATAAGAGTEGKLETAPRAGGSTGLGERAAILLFRTGGGQPMAVPLGLVARLEEIARNEIEFSCGSMVTQYRGRLMPLIRMAAEPDITKPTQPVLVFTDQGRNIGLIVDEIVDVVEDRLNIELSGRHPGLLGSAVIAGRATDVIDTGYWFAQAWGDWFGAGVNAASPET